MAPGTKPTMSGILEAQQGRTPKSHTIRKVAAAVLAVGLFTAFFAAVFSMQDLVAAVPVLRHFQNFLFPLLAIGTILLILPLVFYLSFQEEFGNLNPLIPSHYYFLLKKSMTAIKDNNFKVSAKDM